MRYQQQRFPIRRSRVILMLIGSFYLSTSGSNPSSRLLGAETPTIVAHRGASHDAPENTIAAFKLAWKQNADAIEGDFHLTSDGQIVCLHDKTTRRTAPNQSERKVSDASLKELRSLDVGSWKDARFAGELIPTLREVLDTVPDGKQIFVEIKCGTEILPQLQKELESSSLRPEQIVVICFDADVIAESRRMMPQYQANWLTSYRQDPAVKQVIPSVPSIVKTLDQSSATGFGTQANMNIVTTELINTISESGCSVHAWTVDDPADARELHKRGVRSITTNRPAEIRSAFETKAGIQ